MATMVYMEALSPTMEEGRLVKWLKQEGDAVKVGDALAEVETDKAVMELTARADGVLRQVSVAAGETVPVGHVVAAILAPGEGVGEGPAAARPPTVTGIKRPIREGSHSITAALCTVRSCPSSLRLIPAV